MSKAAQADRKMWSKIYTYDEWMEAQGIPIYRGYYIEDNVAPPTEFAVSPTPRDWPDDRVASFYREYNTAMVTNLTVHEAMPGHVLQLGHARRFEATTPVRVAFWSGPFVEGWAVYAEELMGHEGFTGTSSLLYHTYPPTTVKSARRLREINDKIVQWKYMSGGF